MVRILCAFLVIVTCGALAARLAAEARKSPRFLVDPGQLVAERPPEWMPDTVVSALRADLGRLAPRSIFAEGFQDNLKRDMCAASVWIGDVLQVERLYPNQVRADLRLRRPVATLTAGDTRFLLDGEARCLYAEPASQANSFVLCALLPLTGTDPSLAPVVGGVVDDARVLAGTRVAAEILDPALRFSELVPRVQIVALDVGVATGPLGTSTGEVVLVAAAGARVRWGRPALDPRGALELPVAEKVARLAWIAAKFPGLNGLEEARVDVDQPGIRRVGDGNLEWLPMPRVEGAIGP